MKVGDLLNTLAFPTLHSTLRCAGGLYAPNQLQGANSERGGGGEEGEERGREREKEGVFFVEFFSLFAVVAFSLCP